MPNNPLISVIIPLYNSERFLAQAISSVLEQDYQPLELIVLDDGSSDNSAVVARRFGQRLNYIYQPNAGVSAARNRGVAVASGELIAFLDDDDFWLPGKLTAQADFMRQHPEIGYTITRQQLFLEPGAPEPPPDFMALLSDDTIGAIPSSLMVRAEVFAQIGLFDPTLKYCGDTDWFFRAKDAGVQMSIIPQTLLRKRIHGANASYQVRAGRLEMLRVVRASVARQRQIAGEQWTTNQPSA